MMRAKNRPITCQIVKIVHDDSDEQIEDKEGTDHEEADEEWIGDIGATALGFSCIIRFWIADRTLTKKKLRKEIFSI